MSSCPDARSRKSVRRSVVSHPQGVPEDLLFFYDHLRRGGGVVRVDQSLLLYRFRPGAATQSILEYVGWGLGRGRGRGRGPGGWGGDTDHRAGSDVGYSEGWVSLPRTAD